MSCHPFLDRPILRQKCVVPLGLSMTTKANLLAGKYTFSYSYSDLHYSFTRLPYDPEIAGLQHLLQHKQTKVHISEQEKEE